MREMTDTMKLIYEIVVQTMSNWEAIGVAAYLVNRHINGDLFQDSGNGEFIRMDDVRSGRPEAIAYILKRAAKVRMKTREAWWSHWIAGGSYRCISRTAAQESARRSQYRRDSIAQMARIRS